MINFGYEAASSEAIFGSVARGNLDHLSDQDYLIVDHDPVTRFKRKIALEHQGWSVASYSWSRLRKLIEKGVLFVQHLKQEALVIRDVEDRLKRELSLFVPKYSYRREIDETVRLITSATSNVNTGIERAWASDVLAVGTRNLAILTLAERGQYLFDYDAVINVYADMKRLGSFERQLLSDLRHYKYSYRSGDLSHILSNHDFEMICSILAKSTDGSHFSDFDRRMPFSYPRQSAAYLSQRLVERDLISNVLMPGADQEEYTRVLVRVRKKIVRPRDYGWEFSNPDSKLWKDVEWLSKNTMPFRWLHSCQKADSVGILFSARS